MKIRNEYNSLQRFKQIPDIFLTLDNRVSTILLLDSATIQRRVVRVNFNFETRVDRGMNVSEAILCLRLF